MYPYVREEEGVLTKTYGRESLVKTEADIAVLRHKPLQAPEAERSREGFSPKALGGSMALLS